MGHFGDMRTDEFTFTIIVYSHVYFEVTLIILPQTFTNMDIFQIAYPSPC